MLRKNVNFYDVEIFKDWFAVVVNFKKDGIDDFRTYETGDYLQFQDDVKTNNDDWYCSFNGKQYDDLMLSYWIFSAKGDAELLYILNLHLINKEDLIAGSGISAEKVQKVKDYIKYNIKSISKFNKISHTYENSYYLKSAHKPFKNTIDLFQLNEMSGSLKNSSINMHLPSIEETSLAFGSSVSEGDKAGLIHYCKNDVMVTETMYNKSETNLRVRDSFYELGILDAHNIGSAKLAEAYITRKQAEILGLDYRFWCDKVAVVDKVKGTPRGNLKISELINYDLKYEDKSIQEFYSILNNSIIVAGGNKLIDADGKEIKDLLKFKDDSDNGLSFGLGGIHSFDIMGRWTKQNGYSIINIDVKSFYPSMIAHNLWSPAHCPDFALIIKEVLTKRLAVKKAMGNKELSKEDYTALKVESEGLKLILNSGYGKTNNAFSLLYDPKVSHTITVNGQLLLVKLSDMIKSQIPEAQTIQLNTDGIAYYLPDDKLELFNSIMKEWEIFSGVELDLENYLHWEQSNVNNYLAVAENGDIKSKGASYKIEPENFSQLLTGACIRRALVDKATKGISIEESIRGNKNYKDFLIAGRGSEKTKLYYDGIELPNKFVRYIYAIGGAKLGTKIASSKEIAQKALGYDVKLLLTIDEETFPWGDVDYDAYIYLAKELHSMSIVYQTPTNTPSFAPYKGICTYAEQLYANSARVYDELTGQGLTLMPKKGKGNYPSIKNTDISTWNLVPKDKSFGWGIATGVEFNTITIDIDKPENVDIKLLDILDKYPSMIVFRGDNNPLVGQKGAIVYKYNGNQLESFASLAKHGIEWLYGKKIQTCYGVHQDKDGNYDGEFYQTKGVLSEMPQELIDYLRTIKKPVVKRVKKIDEEVIILGEVYKEQTLNKIMSEFKDIELTLSCEADNGDWVYEFKECGYWFRTYLRVDGSIWFYSNHENFQSEILDPLNQKYSAKAILNNIIELQVEELVLECMNGDDELEHRIVEEVVTSNNIISNTFDELVNDIMSDKKYGDRQFPLFVFPDEVQKYISDNNKCKDTIIDFMGCGFLWACSTIIGNSCKLYIDGTITPAILWFVCVGGTGIGKSPSIKATAKIINNIQFKIRSESPIALDEQEKFTLVLNGGTIQGIGYRQSRISNKNGIGYNGAELAKWFDACNPKNGQERPTWLSWWDNEPDENGLRTKGLGFDLQQPCIPVIGGIQPSIISEHQSSSNKDSGFLDRLIVSYPKVKVADFNLNRVDETFEELYNSKMINLFETIKNFITFEHNEVVPKMYKVDDEGYLLYSKVYNCNTYRMNSELINVYATTAYPKAGQMVLRIALIFQVYEDAQGKFSNNIISAENIKKAFILMEHFINDALELRQLNNKITDINDIMKQNIGKSKRDKFFAILSAGIEITNKSEIARILECDRGTVGDWEKQYIKLNQNKELAKELRKL